MNTTRYILTRSCLQDGSMRLLKYNEPYFPESGPAQFVDDRGKAHEVQVDRNAMRVTGLAGLYHDHNLNVNDVLVIRPAAPHRYEVEAVVKPYATPRSRPRAGQFQRDQAQKGQGQASQRQENRGQESRTQARPEPRGAAGIRSSVGTPEAPTLPTVREVRAGGAGQRLRSGPSGGGGRNLSGLGEERRPGEALPGDAARPGPIPPAFTPQRPRPQPELTPPGVPPRNAERPTVQPPEPRTAEPGTPEPSAAEAGMGAQTQPNHIQPAPEPAPATPQPGGLEDEGLAEQLGEFARLTGYRLTPLGDGLVRLSAELGESYRYSVLLAADPLAMTHPLWESGEDEHRALITPESGRVPGTPGLTREALAALTEHARLVPLSALDLRGYWRAGHLDLESAASVAEWVGAQLAQRGTFTYVLLTLAGQPAQSVVSVSDLAGRLGSALSLDELGQVLDTLARPPFSALTPLPEGQFLLRVAIPDLLADLADYAQGVRRRLRPAPEAG